MIAEHFAQHASHSSDNYRAEDLAEEPSKAIDAPAPPLARQHLAKKHSYLAAEHSHNKSHNSNHNTSDSDSNSDITIDSKLASLAVEAAIAIVINGIHYAVLMASPSQLEYLALGFLFSEGLIEHSYELLDWEISQLTDSTSFESFAKQANTEASVSNASNSSIAFEQLLDYDIYVVELRLSQRCHQRIQAQKRQLAGRTGCGMCGITGLTQALPDLSAYQQHKQHKQPASQQPDQKHNQQAQTATPPSLDSLLAIRAQIDSSQHTHQLTGAVHAAATMQGTKLYLFEDVGRHNALDKLIGWKLRHKAEIECVVMTSRLSIELVQKSIRTQIPWLVGMSAPTSTAVRVAERYGLGLAGFLRDNRVTYYTNFDV